jgi:hypothetical protein
MNKFMVTSTVMVEVEYEIEAGNEAEAEDVVINDIHDMMDEALQSRLMSSSYDIIDVDIEVECEGEANAARFARVGGI